MKKRSYKREKKKIPLNHNSIKEEEQKWERIKAIVHAFDNSDSQQNKTP